MQNVLMGGLTSSLPVHVSKTLLFGPWIRSRTQSRRRSGNPRPLGEAILQ